MVEPAGLSGPVGNLVSMLMRRAQDHRRKQRLRRGKDTTEVRSALETVVSDAVADAGRLLDLPVVS